MKRFRLTLLAISLLLLWLGVSGLSVQWRNQTPKKISLSQLLKNGADQEWVTVEGGYQQLDTAISTTGTLELDSLLVPLKRTPEQEQIDLLIETRDPELLLQFTEYHFNLDSEAEKARFRVAQADLFSRPRSVTGMIIGGLVADNNRGKLEELATQLGMSVAPGIMFIAEGKEPSSLRGYFFLGAGILGLCKFASMLRRKPVQLIPMETNPS